MRSGVRPQVRPTLVTLLALIAFGMGVSDKGYAQQNQQKIQAAKPLVLVIYDEDCQIWCQQVHPVLAKLEKEYGTRVQFFELNATGAHLPISRQKAKDLGVLKFFNDALEYVPDVAVFNAKTKLVKDLSGPKKISEYKVAIETALAQR